MNKISCEPLIRAGAIYSMAPDRAVYRAIAVQDERIVALAAARDGLDSLIGAGTRILDDPSITLLPAPRVHRYPQSPAGSHSQSYFVPAQNARSITELLELIRNRAINTPKGRWIQTSNAWHEQNLAEKRLPTAPELDRATSEHPVLVRRGGHMAVANSLALKLSGLNATTADPPGGKLGRFPDGNLDGTLEGGAQCQFIRVPPLPLEEQIAALEQSCQTFAAGGIGTLRDPVVSPEGIRLYQAAEKSHRLPLRCRPMLLVSPAGSVAERISRIEGFPTPDSFGSDWLKIWGLKFVLDGGPEGGALDKPYANDPSFAGHLNWEPEEIFTVMNAAVKLGWRIGTHAIGDRAVRTLLDVYERVLSTNPNLPPGTLAMEHAFLADQTQRARAIKFGVAVTLRHALL